MRPLTTDTPTLPALAEALPADPGSASGAGDPHTLFTRERQVAFLQALAACGAVRRASAQVGISYRTAYRERRASAPFRLAWDAALLSARALSEDVLATRALDGVEEIVFYRGEEIGRRVRYDARLLLAHLARLDRLTEDARTRAFAEDYEGALERFAAGTDDPAPVCEDCGVALPVGSVPAQAGTSGGSEPSPKAPAFAGGRSSSSGLCDKCDIPPAETAIKRASTNPPGALDAAREAALAAIPCDCPGAQLGTDRGAPHWRMGAGGPEPVCNSDGRGPCCADPRWPDCRDCPHYPPVDRLEHAMAEARPADAPELWRLGEERAVEACQVEAFLAGDSEWWRVGADQVRYRRDGEDGGWYPEDEFEDAA
ncbi:hypothetical protein LY632_06925 [Erythrobacter sp. SDW2]|uniref:hypothetical protein n=1 Tax=Erythrobacter sp. SDW2 TaxID=2907154 RepID=UPI001F203193|nr:hypothetical protein [Erythrobacter sp. SDW2]UIP08121.1 hypothetical protein LY632_06925 [Erythrobacter sp. SDW2]